MAMFAKKENWENKVAAEVGTGPASVPTASKAGSPKYGIAEAIQLMRSLPNDHGGDLVVRVVRATLASLEVRLPDIIEDASRKQKVVRDRIADFHAKNAELEKQLEAHRKEIATLEADLKETTEVKDRLQQAESASALATPGAHAGHKAPITTLLGTSAPKDEPTVIPKA
ncbi:MAG TPA: hypothetical protein VI456_00310 [Polyangia bacterium]